jgi:long-chain acyl-CoA synthetase
MLNLAMLLEDSAREVPQRDAIVFNTTRLSYAALNAAANQIANLLVERGIKPGDKVVISCPNVPYFPMVYYGILKAGAVVVPINVLNKPREIAYALQDSEAKAYFCFEGTPVLPMGEMGYAGFQQAGTCEHFFLMTINPAGPSPIAGATTLGMAMHKQPPTFEMVETNADDTAVILYTSGTTGQPKGAELSHANMMMTARLIDIMVPRMDHDVQLIALPLFHSFAQTPQLNAGIYTRATLVLLPRFSADAALEAMERENVTMFAGVPTMFWELLNYPEASKYDLAKIARNLRVCISGGAAIPGEVLRGFEQKYDVKILEGYGLSETVATGTFNRLDRPSKIGSIGLPAWGIWVRVVDPEGKDVPVGEPGEIIIRGHNVMKGYYKRPEATAEAIRHGWFHTGDIGRRDEEGYLYILDRIKEMILRGGFNVYPREIEEVLMTHPAVSLTAVIGVPHESYGQEVKAFVILKEGVSITEDELIGWCKENMAGYKYPRLVEFRTSLPTTATGKVLKRELLAEELNKVPA